MSTKMTAEEQTTLALNKAQAETARGAVNAAFTWANTPEGVDYWQDVWLRLDAYCKGEWPDIDRVIVEPDTPQEKASTTTEDQPVYPEWPE